MGVSITRIGAHELPQLRAISIKTFTDSFGSLNTAENMNSYINSAFAEKKLQDEIDDTFSEFYFCRENDQVIAYMKVNFGSAQTDFRNDSSLEIERIYVDKAYQGKKIGALLMDFVHQIARERKKDSIWLGVWEHNAGAIRFYERNGFQVIGKHDFMLGNDRQTDLIMRKQLLKP